MARTVLSPASQTQASNCDPTKSDSGQQTGIPQHRQQPRRNSVLIPVPNTVALTDANAFPTSKGLDHKGAIHLLKGILTTDALQSVAGRRTHNCGAMEIKPCCSFTTGDDSGSNRFGDNQSRC